MTILVELARNVGSILGTTFGLILIAVFFGTAAESIEAWWHVPIAYGIALAISGVALALIYGAMTLTVVPMALGWLGMLSGRVPLGFAARNKNGAVAVSNLLLFAGTTYLGLMLFRVGVRDAQVNWSVQGLFLVAAGGAFGLLPAIPRIYFALRASPSASAIKKDEGENVALFGTMALLGIALAWATVDCVAVLRVRDGRTALPYGDWVDSCIDDSLSHCSKDAILDLIPAQVRRLRVEAYAACDVVVKRADGAAVALTPKLELYRAGVKPPSGSLKRFVFDPVAGETYRVHVTTTKSDVCTYSVRYRFEPSGRGGGK